MKAGSCIQEVETCIQTFRGHLEDERRELKKDESKVLNLLSAFYKKDSLEPSTDQMTVSIIFLYSSQLLFSVLKSCGRD
ncbi:hypothetical protein NPIL_277071 [Nephila pilipes]|uniref:Uncharacterized protein n=1 Tax=Nephila pilipes TaxID=299642 RepID=A0A8X6PZY9_NEPPI|nr:hypothetical protein NPIL_277071 [Nephila pilipes]